MHTRTNCLTAHDHKKRCLYAGPRTGTHAHIDARLHGHMDATDARTDERMNARTHRSRTPAGHVRKRWHMAPRYAQIDGGCTHLSNIASHIDDGGKKREAGAKTSAGHYISVDTIVRACMRTCFHVHTDGCKECNPGLHTRACPHVLACMHTRSFSWSPSIWPLRRTTGLPGSLLPYTHARPSRAFLQARRASK